MNSLDALFTSVLDASWRGACLILAFLALRRLLRGRISSRILFWAWIAVALRLLLPFNATVGWSPFEAARRLGEKAPNLLTPKPAAETQAKHQRISLPNEPFVLEQQAPVEAPTITPMRCAALLWLAGALALLAFRLHTRMRTARLLATSPQEPGPELLSLVREEARRAGIGSIQVIVTPAVSSPAIFGLLRSRLLFPPGFLRQLSTEEARMVIAHELAHHSRRDLPVQALLQLATTLHWFNPLVWLAARGAASDCEFACDEHVVSRLGAEGPRAYGATLLKIVRLSSKAAPSPLGLGITQTKNQIAQRIQMIVTHRPSSLLRSALACSALALLASLSLTRETRAQETAAVAASPDISTTAPSGWWKNGTNKGADYVVGVDKTQSREGAPSAYVKSIVSTPKGFGGMMQSCSTEAYVGKRLRLSAWVKTKDVGEGGAHLWFRVDGKESGQMLGFDNMTGRAIVGTADWQLCSIVLDVPDKALALAYGFFVEGAGQAWVNGLKIEEVGKDVPTTDILHKKPANLGFK